MGDHRLSLSLRLVLKLSNDNNDGCAMTHVSRFATPLAARAA